MSTTNAEKFKGEIGIYLNAGLNNIESMIGAAFPTGNINDNYL